MCLITCEVCGKNLMGEGQEFAQVDGLCCPDCTHAFPHYRRLQEENRLAEGKLHRYRDCIDKLLSRTSQALVDGFDEVAVPSQVIRELMSVADYKGDVDKFIYYHHLELMVVAEAASLFYERTNRTNSKTMRQRLENLHEALVLHHKNNYPESKCEFDFGVDELIRRI